MASHENFRALDDLRSLMQYQVTAKIATDSEALERLIAKYYQAAAEGMGEILGELQADDSLKDLKNRGESIDIDSLEEAANSNPVRKLINLVLLQAIKDKASDIHFEPFEGEFKMRYRIDGVLYEMMPPPAHIAPAISSRIKVMANLDIAERRLPQDGRIELNVNNQPIDLRVSVLPTMFGESVVMRVLDRAAVSLDLDKLGMRDEDLVVTRQLIHKPNGIVIVTGPTGSGKTTTLYSALRELNDPTSKLITAEDPVEYDIDGIIQCQIKPEIELTFGRILRSMLRQDPDIILVGEIRDKETAEIAVQASLTGHLVFSTLHTNDAPSAVARLLDLGLEPFLVTATIEGIVAQRLVRKICLNCKTEYTPSSGPAHGARASPRRCRRQKFYYGKGCANCNNTGYRGRFGLYEIMLLDDDMRDMIIQHASTQVLRNGSQKTRHAHPPQRRPPRHLRRHHQHRRSRPRNPRRRHLIARSPHYLAAVRSTAGSPPKIHSSPGPSPSDKPITPSGVARDPVPKEYKNVEVLDRQMGRRRRPGCTGRPYVRNNHPSPPAGDPTPLPPAGDHQSPSPRLQAPSAGNACRPIAS